MIALESLLGRSDARRGLYAPRKRSDALQRAFQCNPYGAGRFWPIATLFVGHDVPHRASPYALRWAKIGSVMAHHIP